MPGLILATRNAGKQRELRALLQDTGWTLHTPQDLGLDLKPNERASTYAGNAFLKAYPWARAAGLWALADDTGLEVEALGMAPGVHSARYGPPGQPLPDDAARRRYLLQQLRPHPRPWKARFRCVLALVSPKGEALFTEGLLEGEILPEERGTHGFGYDPVFYIPDLQRTLAELSTEEKNRISHRARAVQAMRPVLMALAEQG